MRRFGTAAFAAFIVAGAGVVPVVGQQAPSGEKLTPDQIFELHTRQDQPADAQAGRPIFETQCAVCHRFGSLGKEIGPDLTTITSRFQKKDILEAILWPSKVISDQYKSELFELNSGKVISGVVVRESAASVLVRTAESPERPVSIPKGQIRVRGEAKVSMMPEGLLEGYSQTDVANLLAFLMAPAPQ